jgi:hypothetical protein
MAIKTQLVEGQRRIITKVVNGQRRVSCSCCESEPSCCMYPADELGNLYVEDDLPDAVTVNWAGRFTGSMSKSGSGYESGTVSLQVIDHKWTLKDTSTDPESVRVVGRCLIQGDGNLTQGDDLVEDRFEDTYTMSPPSLNGTPLVRRELCLWDDGDEFEVPTAYVRYGLGQVEEGDPFTLGWWLGHDIALDATDFYNFNFETKKTGNQNSPVGSYIFGTGSNTFTVTI